MQRERRKSNDILFHFRKDGLPMTKLNQLKIDPEFQNQINTPSFEETHQLEMNILKEERVLNPIITWNGYKAKRDSSITDSYSSPSKGNEFITTFKQDIQGHKKGLNKEEKQNLKDAVKSIYSPRRLADGEAMMCEIQGMQEDFVRRWEMCFREYPDILATVYKGNIIKNLIMDCQSYTKYRPNETTGGIFVSWRRKEELPTGA